MPQLIRFVARTLRAMRLLVTDRRIPRPVRGLVVVGALPIPGPVDEAVLLLAAGVLYCFYRQPLREAWQRAAVDDRHAR
jgi:hypothetical protein